MVRGRGRRVRPLAAQAASAHRGRDQRGARPPRDLRVAARGAGDVRRRSPRRARCTPVLAAAIRRPTVALAVPGEHNRLNAGAALAALELAGVDVARGRRVAARPSRARAGASRSWAASAGARVVDDYAHHPTEVAATIAAARDARPTAGSSRSSSRTCSRARRPRRAASAPRSPPPTWPSSPASTRPASARRTSPASPGCSSPRRPPTPAARSPGCRRSPTPSATCAPWSREGDLVLTLGAGDVDSVGARARARAERVRRRTRRQWLVKQSGDPAHGPPVVEPCPPRAPRLTGAARGPRRRGPRPRSRLALVPRLLASSPSTSVEVIGLSSSEAEGVRSRARVRAAAG